MKTLLKVLSIGLVGGLCCQVATPKSVARQLHRSLQSHIILSIHNPSFSLAEEYFEKFQKLAHLKNQQVDTPCGFLLSFRKPIPFTHLELFASQIVDCTVEYIIWENDE